MCENRVKQCCECVMCTWSPPASIHSSKEKLKVIRRLNNAIFQAPDHCLRPDFWLLSHFVLYNFSLGSFVLQRLDDKDVEEERKCPLFSGQTLLYQRSGPEKGCDKSQSVFMKATIKAWTERGEIRVRLSSHQDKDRKALRLETLLGEFFSHQLPRHTWISLRRQKVPNCDMNISQRNTCTSCNNSNNRQELML